MSSIAAIKDVVSSLFLTELLKGMALTGRQRGTHVQSVE